MSSGWLVVLVFNIYTYRYVFEPWEVPLLIPCFGLLARVTVSSYKRVLVLPFGWLAVVFQSTRVAEATISLVRTVLVTSHSLISRASLIFLSSLSSLNVLVVTCERGWG